MSKNYFRIEETPYHPSEFLIKANFDLLPLRTTKGSYGFLCARLMGLSCADYCRMCRDVFGATIRGKGSMYPTVYFKKSKELDLLVRILNKRMEYIMLLRENNLSPEKEEQWRAENEKILIQATK